MAVRTELWSLSVCPTTPALPAYSGGKLTDDVEDHGGLVRVAGMSIRLAQLRDRPGRYGAVLAHAKATEGHAECLCADPPRRLVIRNNSRTGLFYLARWPGDDQHAGGCGFHRLDNSLSGRSTYTAAAIQETVDGISIRLAAALTRNTSNRRAATTHHDRPAAQADAAPARRAVGLLGLLHLLLDESGMTVWRRGARYRSWGVCAAAFRRCAATCRLNSATPLSEVLYVVPQYTGKQDPNGQSAFDDFLDRLNSTRSRVPRGLILGEIREIKPAKYSLSYHLAHHPKPVYVTPELDRAARISYPVAFAEAGTSAGGHRLALFLVERMSSGNLRVVDMAVALTTAHRIPVDSSLELRMADALVEHRRGFVKPLRFDAAHDVVLPDFVLTDTQPHALVEVYGVRGREAYDQRKAAKQALYQAGDRPVVTWDGVGELPDLALR
ncbi:DUF1173 family protein [Nocardia sp. NPDC059239]|uniref:DUF1173 family protein n=1 Tax=Nocardia sp. NPDC059239 TaxID=3346785 RepID=UPI003674FD10